MACVPSNYYDTQSTGGYTYTSNWSNDSTTGTDCIEATYKRDGYSHTYTFPPEPKDNSDSKWKAYLAKRALSILGQNWCAEDHDNLCYNPPIVPAIKRRSYCGRSPSNSGKQYRARGIK